MEEGIKSYIDNQVKLEVAQIMKLARSTQYSPSEKMRIYEAAKSLKGTDDIKYMNSLLFPDHSPAVRVPTKFSFPTALFT